MAYLVSYVEGVFVETRREYVAELRALASFLVMEVLFEPGQRVGRTVDCFTWGGVVKLFHTDNAQLCADYDRIRVMEETGLFVVSP